MGEHGQTSGSTIKEENLLQVTTHIYTLTGEITLRFMYNQKKLILNVNNVG